jgi:hypothetical protein
MLELAAFAPVAICATVLLVLRWEKRQRRLERRRAK